MIGLLYFIIVEGNHYSDVIMGAMVPHITILTMVYSTVYSGADQKKTSKFHVTGVCEGNSPVTGEFPTQMASNAENASIDDVIMVNHTGIKADYVDIKDKMKQIWIHKHGTHIKKKFMISPLQGF